jgi:hypothetical protein
MAIVCVPVGRVNRALAIDISDVRREATGNGCP